MGEKQRSGSGGGLTPLCLPGKWRVALPAALMLFVGGCWGPVNVVVNQNTGEEAEVIAETKEGTNEQLDSEKVDFDATTSGENSSIDIERRDSPSTDLDAPFTPESTDTDVRIGK